MSRENDIQTIKETAIRFRAKLLYLIDNYEQYYENYSKEALNLHNELFNFNDAVEMLEYKDFSSFDVLNNESIKKVAYLSRQVAKAYSISLQYNEINVDNIELPDGWIVEKDDDNQIVRVIYNKGNDVVFVNKYGEVQSIVKSPTTSKTKFLNKTLQINNAEEMLINASYTYYLDIDRFLPEDDAKRAFDITGKIELGTTFEKKTDQKIKQTKTTMTTAKKVTKKIEKQEKKKEVKIVEKKEIDNKFTFEIFNKAPSVTSSKIWNKKAMENENLFALSVDNTKCNKFLPIYLKSISDTVYKDIITEENAKASRLNELFSQNSKLYKITGNEYDVTERIPKYNRNGKLFIEQKKEYSAAKKAIIAQDLANESKIVIAYVTDHVAIVTKQDTLYSSYPEKNWNSNNSVSPFQTGDGYSNGNVLDGFPVFLQAGSYTGVVNPGMAMGRNSFTNDEVIYYVYKG